MLIFLDIDGVLNRHNFNKDAGSNLIERDLVETLNDILVLTGANIVISSAWRYIIHRGEANLIGFDWLLRSHGLIGQRLVGFTREDRLLEPPHYDGLRYNHWPVVPNERGSQIQEWLNENCSSDEPYVVLDDGGYVNEGPNKGQWTDLGITANGHPTIWTHSKVGLTRDQAYLAVDLLLGNVKTWPDSPMRGTYEDRVWTR